MQGIIQQIQADRNFGFIRGPEGGKVFFHRSALTHPDSFATLEVGMGVEFEPQSGPKGPHAAKITVTPVETHPKLSFDELAAYFQRHAAS